MATCFNHAVSAMALEMIEAMQLVASYFPQRLFCILRLYGVSLSPPPQAMNHIMEYIQLPGYIVIL